MAGHAQALIQHVGDAPFVINIAFEGYHDGAARFAHGASSGSCLASINGRSSCGPRSGTSGSLSSFTSASSSAKANARRYLGNADRCNGSATGIARQCFGCAFKGKLRALRHHLLADRR
jgi:type IV secretory pathway TrbL component